MRVCNSEWEGQTSEQHEPQDEAGQLLCIVDKLRTLLGHLHEVFQLSYLILQRLSQTCTCTQVFLVVKQTFEGGECVCVCV